MSKANSLARIANSHNEINGIYNDSTFEDLEENIIWSINYVLTCRTKFKNIHCNSVTQTINTWEEYAKALITLGI